MQFTVNIDYKRTPEMIAKISNQALTLNYLESCVFSVYPKLGGSLMRMFGRIQTKCDQAIIDKADSIELEVAEFDFIKKCWFDDKSKFDSPLAKYVVLLEDEINRVATLPK